MKPKLLFDISSQKTLFKRLLWVLLIYFFLRLLFLIFNFKDFSGHSFGNIASCFLEGIRFDLSGIFLSNILYILFSQIFQNVVIFQKILKYLYFISNSLFFLINIIDLDYYKFIGRRSTFQLIGIAGDIGDQAFSLLAGYMHLIVIWLIISLIFVRFAPKTQKEDLRKWNVISRVSYLLFVFLISILAYRGGWQTKLLRINQAFGLNDNALGNLTLNSTFSLLTTLGKKTLPSYDWFTDQELAGIIKTPVIRDTIFTEKPNVVLIILESFSREYMGYKNPYEGYTPFLDSLATNSVFIENFYANGRESIHALPAIFGGIPHLMEESFITSQYQQTDFEGIGTALTKCGYESAFFHAARNGSMGFQGFCEQAGIQKYYGLDEYPGGKSSVDFDGTWGIFDEPYLNYFAKKNSEFHEPFFSSVFTLSSHHPFKIPLSHKGEFKEGKSPIHKVIRYSDYALKQFFQVAKKESWFQNTVFLITADHTQFNTEESYSNEKGAYRIPLIIFSPDNVLMAKIRLHSDAKKVGQQVDILPTILELTSCGNTKIGKLGNSIFDKTKGEAIHFHQGKYTWYSDLEEIDYSAAQNWDKKDKEPSERRLHAIIQYFNQSLIANKFKENP